MNGCATISRGSADKPAKTEYNMLELTMCLPDEYVDTISSDSDPDCDTPKFNPAISKRTTPLNTIQQPNGSTKRSIFIIEKRRSSPSFKQKMSGINETLHKNIDEYYSQVQQLQRKNRIQEKQLDSLCSKLTYLSENSNIGPFDTSKSGKDE